MWARAGNVSTGVEKFSMVLFSELSSTVCSRLRASESVDRKKKTVLITYSWKVQVKFSMRFPNTDFRIEIPSSNLSLTEVIALSEQLF